MWCAFHGSSRFIQPVKVNGKYLELNESTRGPTAYPCADCTCMHSVTGAGSKSTRAQCSNNNKRCTGSSHACQASTRLIHAMAGYPSLPGTTDRTIPAQLHTKMCVPSSQHTLVLAVHWHQSQQTQAAPHMGAVAQCQDTWIRLPV